MASNKLARTNDDIQRVLANLLTQVKAKSHNGNMVLRFSVRNNSMLSGNSDD